MTLDKLAVALLGVMLCAHLSAARIISFHAPTSVPAPKAAIGHGDFRIVIPDGSAPSYAALAAPAEPAPVREEQNDIPPPQRVLPPIRPVQPQPPPVQMVNPPAFAADAAAAFGFAPAPGAAPQPLAASPATPTAAPGVVQLVHSVIPNAGSRIVEPPPAIVPPPDAVNYVPLREQAQQLIAQGYNLEPYNPAPGAALSASAPRLNAPTQASQTYASNFGSFQAPAQPAFAAPAPAPARIAPLVPQSPLARQSSAFGKMAEAALPSNDGGLQITHHPGHGEGGATSYSASSFTNKVQ